MNVWNRALSVQPRRSWLGVAIPAHSLPIAQTVLLEPLHLPFPTSRVMGSKSFSATPVLRSLVFNFIQRFRSSSPCPALQENGQADIRVVMGKLASLSR